MSEIAAESQEPGFIPASADEILAMKERFKDQGLLRRVSAREALAIYLEPGEKFSREDFALRVGSLAASYALDINTAIKLPGTNWPEGMSPPELMIEWLKDYDKSIQGMTAERPGDG